MARRATVHEDLPPEELRFRFLGGRPGLDLVATVGERWRRGFERLRAPDDLGRWAVEAGLLATPPDVTARQLDDARALREAIYRCAKAAMAGRRFPPEDVRLINQWARMSPPAPQLGTRPGQRTTSASNPVRAMLSALARDAVDLLGGSDAGRIRECAAPDCALVYLDRSPGGRRRWCSMTLCGNRVKCAIYRRRTRVPPGGHARE